MRLVTRQKEGSHVVNQSIELSEPEVASGFNHSS